MIFVPKNNIYFPQPFTGPKFQRGILHPIGFWQEPAAAGGLVTTITSGSSSIIKSKKKGTKVTATLRGYGFDAGSDAHFLTGSFGSIANGVYDDGVPNSRTVDSCYWVTDDETSLRRNRLVFVLDTTSVPNTDTTFVSIKIDGVEFLRSTATYFSSVDGGTLWSWASVTPNPFAGTNPDNFEITI